jgi:hypothetical protein
VRGSAAFATAVAGSPSPYYPTSSFVPSRHATQVLTHAAAVSRGAQAATRPYRCSGARGCCTGMRRHSVILTVVGLVEVSIEAEGSWCEAGRRAAGSTT